MADDTLNLETIFKAVHSTGTKIIEWDQEIPAFAKLSLNDTRENFCNSVLVEGASTMATTPCRGEQEITYVNPPIIRDNFAQKTLCIIMLC